MTFDVYTYGGGEAIYQTLTAVAGLMGGPDYLGLIKVFMVLGLFWVVIEMGVLHETLNWHWFIMFALMFNIFFVPKENVIIHDRFNPSQTRMVGNVPFGLAAPAWLFSTISDGLTRMVETWWTQPNDMMYASTGMVFGSRLMSSINNARFDDPLLNKNLVMYAKQCVYMNIAYGFYTVSDVYKSNDLLNLLLSTTNNSDLRGVFLTNSTGHSTYYSCRNAARRLKADIKPVASSMVSRYANAFFFYTGQGPAQNRARMLAALPAAYGYLAGISTTAQQMVTQAALANYFENSYGQVAAMSGNAAAATAWSTAVAERQQRSSYRTMGMIAQRALPEFQTLFRSIIYASFFIVFLALMLPITVGGKALRIYFQMFLWIELWPILFAFVNMVTNLYAKAATHGVLDPSLGITSMAGLYGMATVNSDMSIIAGYMALSVPVFAWAIASGSAQSLSAVSTALFAPAVQAANQAGGEIGRGNISTGNLSAGNQSIMQGQSAPNTNIGATFNDGQSSTTVSPTGRASTTTSFSNLGITSTAQTNLQRSAHESLGNTLTATHQDVSSLATSQRQEAQASQDFVKQASTGGTEQEKRDVSAITGSGESFKSSTSVVDDFSNKTGMSKDRSAAVLAYIRGQVNEGTPFAGILGSSASITEGAEATGTSKADFSKAVNAAHSGHYDDAYSKATTTEHKLADLASVGHTAGNTTTAADRLAETSSEVKSGEQRTSADLSRVKTLQNVEDFASSRSQTSSLNMGQAVKDYASEVMHLPVSDMTPSQLGELATATGGEQFQEFIINRFGSEAGLYSSENLTPGQSGTSQAVAGSVGKEFGMSNKDAIDVLTHVGDPNYHPTDPHKQEALASPNIHAAAALYNSDKSNETKLNPSTITGQHQADKKEVAGTAAATQTPTSGVTAARDGSGVDPGVTQHVTGTDGQTAQQRVDAGAVQAKHDQGTFDKGKDNTTKEALQRKDSVQGTPHNVVTPALVGGVDSTGLPHAADLAVKTGTDAAAEVGHVAQAAAAAIMNPGSAMRDLESFLGRPEPAKKPPSSNDDDLPPP